MLTYFNGEYGLSVRYPASWKTDQAQQEGMWYRYFLGPPTGPDRKPSVSVTLLAGPLQGSVVDYAQTYLAGNTVSTTRDEQRQGARGKSFDFASADGKTRFMLVLVGEEKPPMPPSPPPPRPPRTDAGAAPVTVAATLPVAPAVPGPHVYGLYAQASAEQFEKHKAVLEEMAQSLTLERVEAWGEQRNDAHHVVLRVPPSWTANRTFSGGQSLMLQYTSPALAAEKGQTVHASLTVTVEPAPKGLEPFYKATRDKMGDSFDLFTHHQWKDGYVDTMGTETSMSESRVKRFYRAHYGLGYSLTFEAREDVFQKVNKWCDLIASTLRIAGEKP